MAKNDFQYGGWDFYTLQCGMSLWNHDSEFTKWQHPVMWQLALGWDMLLNSLGGTTLQCDTSLWDDIPLNSPKCPPYWNYTSGFDLDHITAINMLFWTSLRNFIQIGSRSAEKMKSCRFSRWWISAILDFRGPIMDSFGKPMYDFL